MVWIFIWLIAMLVIPVLCFCYGYGFFDKIFTSIISLILTFIIGIIAVVGLNSLFYSPVENLELIETQKIYSLKDNSYLSGYGNFISVKIEEEDKYTYMVINEDDTYSKRTIKSKNVKIKEVSDKEPVLEIYVCKSKNEFWSMYSVNYYRFVVPNGTVVNTFNVDLE